jgi:hypothetical protein
MSPFSSACLSLNAYNARYLPVVVTVFPSCGIRLEKSGGFRDRASRNRSSAFLLTSVRRLFVFDAFGNDDMIFRAELREKIDCNQDSCQQDDTFQHELSPDSWQLLWVN